MRDVAIRPMTEADVTVAEEISDEAFHEVDRATFLPTWRTPERRTPERSQRWIARTRATLARDPGGSWVAERDDEVLGFATGFRREDLWCLATFAVRPGVQGHGIGRPLLEAAAGHGAECPRWMLSASPDPRAVRRYHSMGFELHPQMLLMGAVDRTALPSVDGVRDGTHDDRTWMDELDRRLRGGPHGPDHDALCAAHRLVVDDARRGYAYTSQGRLGMLAAGDDETARRLLWECLAGSADRYEAFHITGANRWAVDIGVRARLGLGQHGFLGLRGMAPPTPYIHDGALL